MEPALTPRLALSYLRELSADFRGGAVLDSGARALAGDPAVAAAAARVLSAGGDGVAVPVAGHVIHAARSGTHAVVAVYGELALPGLVRHDLAVVLADLAEVGPAGAPADAPAGTPADAPAGTPADAPAGTPADAPAGTAEAAPAACPSNPSEPPSEALRAAAEALFFAVQSGSAAPDRRSEP